MARDEIADYFECTGDRINNAMTSLMGFAEDPARDARLTAHLTQDERDRVLYEVEQRRRERPSR